MIFVSMILCGKKANKDNSPRPYFPLPLKIIRSV